MNKFNAKLSAAVAMAVVIATTLAPVAMADTINITENGENSNNSVTVTSANVTSVSQSNETLIVNGVLAVSNTGLNDANGNTGGNVDVATGNTTTKVTVENTGSSNDAVLPDCGCQKPDTTINIKKNGEKSKNTVNVVNSNTQVVSQGNSSAIINLIGVVSNTGLNDANSNTGGKTSIKTGKTKTRINIKNTGSSNTLK